jgi:hypothetical protein
MKQALEALDSDDPSIQLRSAVVLRQAIEQAEDAVAVEREACAVLCENFYRNGNWITKEEAAAAIRARGVVHASDTSQEHVDETEKDKHEWVGLDHEQMRNTPLQFNRGALWAERYLKEKNNA